jgi:hypothetical protein
MKSLPFVSLCLALLASACASGGAKVPSLPAGGEWRLLNVEKAAKASPSELARSVLTLNEEQLDQMLNASERIDLPPEAGTPGVKVFELSPMLGDSTLPSAPRIYGIVPYCFPRQGQRCGTSAAVERDGQIFVQHCKCDGPQMPLRSICEFGVWPVGCRGTCAEPNTRCRLVMNVDDMLNFYFHCRCSLKY